MNVDFITAIKLFFANYANFRGRSTRAEYWWAMLFLFILSVVTGWIPFLGNIIMLAVIIPSLAILTRRFHDTGRSGWWVLGLYVVEIIGCIIAFGSMGTAFFTAAAANDTATLVEIIETHSSSMGLGALIAVAASIVSFIFTLLPSGPDNQYGPDPYGTGADEVQL